MFTSSVIKSVVAVALLVGSVVACSSEGDGAESAAPLSAQEGFCASLASSYAKCSGGGGPSASCKESLGADCAKLAGLLSAPVLDAAKGCVEQTACGSDPLACLGTSLASASLTGAQTKLATDYCESCAVVGGEACKTAFFGTASVPGLAYALLPFGDGLLEAIDEDCTSSKLGKAACQSAFSTCLTATTTKFLAKSISVDSGKCVIEGIKEGLASAGKSTPDAPAGGCEGCKGCCADGVCQKGDTAAACGAGGAACETCQGEATCSAGKCATKCGPDNCAGCCDASGACITSGTASACGKGGQACTTCSGTKTCEAGACIETSCKASCASGCCSSTGCQTGKTTAACGTGGGVCSACGAGQACNAGACTTSSTATFDLVAVSAKLPAKKSNGDDWDGFGGLPDPLVKATSGSLSGTSPSRTDTLAPVWNATLLSGVTAAALKSSLRVDVSDVDVAFNDPVGGCAVTLSNADFDGAPHTVNCPASGSGVAFSLVYRLLAR
ncbi:MAG: hypothetical protein JST00_12615 [Deltaproteobacteria bacterium]|nr:hypothetical protein [Deltaproteobacteria bacterium]